MTEAEKREAAYDCLLLHLSDPRVYPYSRVLKKWVGPKNQSFSEDDVAAITDSGRKYRDIEYLTEVGRYNPNVPVQLTETMHGLQKLISETVEGGYRHDPVDAKVLLDNARAFKTILEGLKIAQELNQTVKAASLPEASQVIDVT
jgi:ribosomal protein S16